MSIEPEPALNSQPAASAKPAAAPVPAPTGSVKNYFEVLGVGQDADEAAIKKAYRKLALKYHPDKNPSDKTAEGNFQLLGNAFEILKDPQKRPLYTEMLNEKGHALAAETVAVTMPTPAPAPTRDDWDADLTTPDGVRRALLRYREEYEGKVVREEYRNVESDNMQILEIIQKMCHLTDPGRGLSAAAFCDEASQINSQNRGGRLGAIYNAIQANATAGLLQSVVNASASHEEISLENRVSCLSRLEYIATAEARSRDFYSGEGFFSECVLWVNSLKQ